MRKNILITGSTGFIGKKLVNELSRSCPEHNIILLTSKIQEGYTSVLHKDYQFSIKDFALTGIENIDIIIHSGAFTPKTSSNQNDIHHSNKNIVNTEYLLNNTPIKKGKIVFLSTLDVYGDANNITERTSAQPQSLYAWSKLYCEKMIEQWAKDHECLYTILRIGHIYGPGEEAYQKLIPVTIRNCLNNINPILFGSGRDLRSFLYIDDCVKAIASAIFKDTNDLYNIVSNESFSIRDVISIIKNKINKNLNIITKQTDLRRKDLVFDATKMLNELYVPQTPFSQGIQLEIDHFRYLLAENR